MPLGASPRGLVRIRALGGFDAGRQAQGLQADSAALALVPQQVAWSHHVLPLSRGQQMLVAVVSDKSPACVGDALRSLSGCNVQVVRATDAELTKALIRYYGHPWPQPATAAEA